MRSLRNMEFRGKARHSPNTPISAEDGCSLTLSQAIEQHTQSKNAIGVIVGKYQKWNHYKMWICMTTFLLALLCLIISRSSGLFISCSRIL